MSELNRPTMPALHQQLCALYFNTHGVQHSSHAQNLLSSKEFSPSHTSCGGQFSGASFDDVSEMSPRDLQLALEAGEDWNDEEEGKKQHNILPCGSVPQHHLQ